jgi:hypothetical protein
MLADRSLQYSQPCTCDPASQQLAEEGATDCNGRWEPKRPVYVLKGRPTAGRDEAAPGGAEAPAAERVTHPLAAALFEGLVAAIWGRFGAAVLGFKNWAI